MEVILGAAVVILFAWAAGDYLHSRKFNKLFKERNDIEKEKIFVERSKNQFTQKRWDEHKQIRGFGDFKMAKLKAVNDTLPPIPKVETTTVPPKTEPLVPFMEKFRDLTKGGAMKPGFKKPTVSSTVVDH